MSARLLCAVLCLSLLGCGARAARPQSEALDLRQELPRTWVGPTPFDPAELEGQAVAITFFATWCLPCLGQLALWGELQAEYGGRGLRVVAVGMDLDGARVLAPFAEAYPRGYPVLVADPRIHSGESGFGKVKVLPSNAILDRRGQVVAVWPGLAEADEVRAQVERALRR